MYQGNQCRPAHYANRQPGHHAWQTKSHIIVCQSANHAAEAKCSGAGHSQCDLRISRANRFNRNFNSPDDAFKKVVECQKSTIGLFENIASQFENVCTGLDNNDMALSARISLVENANANQPNRRILSESRCVSNLKTLGSRKEGFKNWNEN